MLRICRAEDGQIFEVNATIWDIERTGSLESFLQKHTGVDLDCIIAYISDGTRLQNENVRDLAGVQDQTIYVFNTKCLELDLDSVLRRLHVEPRLEPPVEEGISATPPFRPSILVSSYLRTAHLHLEEITRLATAIRWQHEALSVTTNSLDLHVLTVQDTYDGIMALLHNEFDQHSTLLAGVDIDLHVVSRVLVHKDFLSKKHRDAMALGHPGTTLGDYISQERMRQVAQACIRSQLELQDRLHRTSDLMVTLREGTDALRPVAADMSVVEEADMSARRSRDMAKKVADLAASLDKPSAQPDRILQDIRQLDASLRTELERSVDRKNSYTERFIAALRQISVLNTDMVQIPSELSSLQASFRNKGGIPHIQRLHSMLYDYGATLIEIVRRKEFAQFFYQRAQSILEVMAKLSANEQKRRQVYRGDIVRRLPFALTGMDDPVPTIDFSPRGSTESPYDVQRADIDDFMHTLDGLEEHARELSNPAALEFIHETRSNLEKLVNKMNGFEPAFDRIAERSILSSSKFLENRRRSTEADDKAFAELEQQLLQTQQMLTEKDAQFGKERRALQDEVARLRQQLEDADSQRNPLERDVHALKAQLQSETASRRIQEQRNTELADEADKLRQSLAAALAEATEKTRGAELLRLELAQVRAEFEDVKALEQRNADKMNSLLEDQANALRRLEEARSCGEDLETQIQAARLESDEVKRALAEAGKEKDRLLRAQATEHDRRMRDQQVEADGDRAVLERQYQELKAALDDAQRQLKDTRAQADMTNSDAVGLREELQRVEHELREARHVERVLREDLRAGRASQSNFEQRVENSSRLVAQILDVSLAFRESHVKAQKAIETMTSHPSSSKTLAVNHLDEPSPIDPSDPATALEALRAVDHDQFLDAVNKAGQTIRKWQKQCKEYREKAKGKISFRNFAKGDLALFLPTRNSVTKPWAAFNVSFPHYFLKATGHLAEQLKTREWIVARITSIAEGVVDTKDPSTNPYALGDGVKYYMLEVEDWTQPSHAPKRRPAKKPTSPALADSSTDAATPEPTPGPPNPDLEVEETFPSRTPPSQMLTSRGRGNSLTATGRSSLSRLLAQAPAENSGEGAQRQQPSRSPTPPAEAPVMPPPSPTHTMSPAQGTPTPIPFRSGSRASRISTSSRFSTVRIPFAGTPGNSKAIATTALAPAPVQAISASPSSTNSAESPKSAAMSVSPEGAASDGAAGLLSYHRRRASSFQPRNSPLAVVQDLPSTRPSSTVITNDSGGASSGSARTRLASLASGWGVPFGRKKTNGSLVGESPLPGTASSTAAESHERAAHSDS